MNLTFLAPLFYYFQRQRQQDYDRVNQQRGENGLPPLSTQEYQRCKKKGRVQVKRTVQHSTRERYQVPKARTGSPRLTQAQFERQYKMKQHLQHNWKLYATAFTLGVIMYAGFNSDFSQIPVSYDIKPT